MTIAVYPGSFDPITNGHLDVAARASKLFDKVIVAVFNRPNKTLLFSVEERVELAKEATACLPNVIIESFTGLTVDFARKMQAHVLIRGLRMTSDFENEFSMAMMNKKLYPELEMVTFMTSLKYQFLSSTLLKEVACLSGNIDDLVPKNVAEALRIKFKDRLQAKHQQEEGYCM